MRQSVVSGSDLHSLLLPRHQTQYDDNDDDDDCNNKGHRLGQRSSSASITITTTNSSPPPRRRFNRRRRRYCCGWARCLLLAFLALVCLAVVTLQFVAFTTMLSTGIKHSSSLFMSPDLQQESRITGVLVEVIIPTLLSRNLTSLVEDLTKADSSFRSVQGLLTVVPRVFGISNYNNDNNNDNDNDNDNDSGSSGSDKRWKTSSPYQREDLVNVLSPSYGIDVVLPFELQQKLLDNDESELLGKAKQFAHFDAIFRHVCERHRHISSKHRHWLLLGDEDVQFCPDASIYLPFILNFAETYRERLTAIRFGLGSSGILMSSSVLCELSTFVHSKLVQNTDLVVDPYQGQNLTRAVDAFDWSIDEQIDQFLLRRMKDGLGVYLGFRQNLLWHNNSLSSSVSDHGTDIRTYGHCHYPLHWPGMVQLHSESCAREQRAFSPCTFSHSNYWSIHIPTLRDHDSLCKQGAVNTAMLDNFRVVIAAPGQSCSEGCAQSNLQCVPQLMNTFISEEQFLDTLPQCSGGVKSSILLPAPFIDNRHKICNRPAFGCETAEIFCKAKFLHTDTFGSKMRQRICPCSTVA